MTKFGALNVFFIRNILSTDMHYLYISFLFNNKMTKTKLMLSGVKKRNKVELKDDAIVILASAT